VIQVEDGAFVVVSASPGSRTEPATVATSGAASSGNTGGRDESLKVMTYILLRVPFP
jgi:hypothetical protein